MGKKAKEHRKRVAKRNADIQQKLKSFQKIMQKSSEEARMQQMIAKNYEIINTKLPSQQATALLEEGGPQFS